MVRKMVDYKLIDYPHCAVCGNSEQYNDNTFICCLADDEQPVQSIECDVQKVSDAYLVGYLTLLTKMIKKILKM